MLLLFKMNATYITIIKRIKNVPSALLSYKSKQKFLRT